MICFYEAKTKKKRRKILLFIGLEPITFTFIANGLTHCAKETYELYKNLNNNLITIKLQRIHSAQNLY